MQTDLATPTRQRGRGVRVPSSFVKFMAVGAVAYVISLVTIFLLYEVLPILPDKETRVDFGLFTEPDISLLIASAIGVELAITFKFFALQKFAFPDRARRGHPIARFIRFNGSCLGSSLIVVTAVNVLTPVFDISPYIATTFGTALGFAVNWGFSHYLIWPHQDEESKVKPVDG